MRKLYLIACLLCGLNAQSQTRSFDVWTSVSTGSEVYENLSLSIEEGVRFSDFAPSLWYQDLTAKYAFNDYFKMAATWRYGGRGNLFDVNAIDNRFQIDASGKYEIIDNVKLGLRARYQKRYRDMFVSENGLLSADYLRLRPAVAVKVTKDFSVDVGFETYLQTNNVEGNFMDKYRVYVGMDHDLGDYHEIGVSYILQQEVQVANPHTRHIVSAAYSFKLDKYLKKRKEPVKKLEEQIINWYRLPRN